MATTTPPSSPSEDPVFLDETLTGGTGADTLQGRDGADVIFGGDGNDILYGGWQTDPTGALPPITATRVASGLNAPLFGTAPPGDTGRLFVVEKNEGRIQILDTATGQVTGTFLDIPNGNLSTSGESGLLGLAFHPDYQTNGRFFVFLTNPAGNIEVWEYARASANAANPTPVQMVISIPHPTNDNHNGGWMGFGPDGYLYIATGDGGGGNDPAGNAQNPDALLGKMLRLDVNGDAFPGDSTRNYAIPPGNPFVGTAGADEVFMLGLRNPWRASFDSEGGFWIADVGQGRFEEVNYIRPGEGAGFNFGWPSWEGDARHIGPEVGGTVFPVHTYGRTEGQSITGGYVYEGPGGLNGTYVFADFASGAIWAYQDGQVTNLLGRISTNVGTINQIASFAMDGQGRLYVIGLDGEIHRLEAAVDGADELYGGAGNDTLYGGSGDDRLFGGLGEDIINGGIGNDTLVGDELGVASVDQLNGGDGDDLIYADQLDIINGGAGYDRLIAVNDAAMTLNMATSSIEYAVLGGGADQVNASAQTVGVSVFAGGGNDSVAGSGFGDLIFGGSGNDVITGGAGDDALVGELGADSLSGGEGNDRIYFDAQDTTVSGGAGFDVGYITVGTGGGVTLNMATASLEYLVDTAGQSDTVTAASASERIFVYAGGGADTVTGSAFDDVLWGEAGDDILSGAAGADVLVGGAGSDRLAGGAGVDALYGGAGDGAADTFVFEHSGAANADAVYDFALGVDKLDVSVFGASFANVSITTAGADSIVYLNGQQICTIVGLTGLTAGDFIFAAPASPALIEQPEIRPDEPGFKASPLDDAVICVVPAVQSDVDPVSMDRSGWMRHAPVRDYDWIA